MKFAISACVAILAAIAEARVAFTNSAYAVEADKPFQLTWSGATGPVTIFLKDGPADNLRTVETLASGLSGGSTTVTLKASQLKSGTYAFGIKDTSADPENYSPRFQIVGSGSASTTASGSTTASSTGSLTTSTSASTSASVTARPTGNTTTTATTSSRSNTSTSSRTSAATTPASTTAASPPNTGAGAQLQSSLALVFLGAAAYVFLN